MNFRAYVFRRLLLMLIVLFGVVSITFVISHVIPADPIGAILGPKAPDEVIEKLRQATTRTVHKLCLESPTRRSRKIDTHEQAHNTRLDGAFP